MWIIITAVLAVGVAVRVGIYVGYPNRIVFTLIEAIDRGVAVGIRHKVSGRAPWCLENIRGAVAVWGTAMQVGC